MVNSGQNIKQIASDGGVFFKHYLYLVSFLIGLFICFVIFSNGFYIVAIIAVPMTLIMLVLFFLSFKRSIADRVFLDYDNKKFIFVYNNANKTIEKSFSELLKVRRRGSGFLLLTFMNKEIHSFYLPQISIDWPKDQKTIFNELESIAESNG